MNIIPLVNKEVPTQEKKNNLQIQIPSEWWNSNYSCNFSIKKCSHIHEIRKIHITNLPKTPGWNIQKGDYRIKESKVNTRDYVSHRKLKLKILKYSLYPVIAVTIIVILKISEILSII